MREPGPLQPPRARILTKLKQLRTLDPTYRCFGSKTHRYRLKPCLSAARLKDLEQHYQIRLPHEYRWFLQEIGNGGAGPDYGLSSLKEALEGIEPDTLRAPFVPPTSHAEAMASEEGYEQGLLELGDIGCGLVNFLVVSGVEYGHVWHGWSGLPLPAVPLDGEMEALWNKSGQDERPGRYRRWVDAVLAPTNRERLTFLPWYEDNLDRAIKQCSAG